MLGGDESTAVASVRLGHGGSLPDVAAGLIGGSTALAGHTGKAGTRMAVNTSPEPFSDIVLSLAEDLGVAGLVARRRGKRRIRETRQRREERRPAPRVP